MWHSAVNSCTPTHFTLGIIYKWRQKRLLTHKAPSIICSRQQFQILPPLQKITIRHGISWELSAGRQFSWYIIPYFFCKLGKMLQNLSPAAVLIGALRLNLWACASLVMSSHTTSSQVISNGCTRYNLQRVFLTKISAFLPINHNEKIH